MDFIGQPLTQYCEQHSSSESELLQNLAKETWQKVINPRMLSGSLQGAYLKFISKLIQPRRILEIGTYTGYSTLCMALSAPTAKITALDVNIEWTKIAKNYWHEAGVSERITLILAPALESLKNFSNNSFDLIFIDADKRNYPSYYKESLRLLSNTGVLLIDNVLWNGRVIDPNYTDTLTNVIRKFNETIKNDERVDVCMLPIGDGLTMIRKKMVAEEGLEPPTPGL